jgi:phospholipid-binding lipoprotein MlaA
VRTLVASVALGLVLGVPGPSAVTLAAPAASAAARPDPLFDEDADEQHADGPADPFESVNRVTFAVNRQIDRFVFEPITRVYRFVVPGILRRGLRRALVNLDAPVTIVNDVLQLEPRDAAVTVARFVVNSTAGVAGFMDVADWNLGMKGHESDFGQTMALAGVPSGPYLMLPILGPNNARDTAGYVVDFLFRPTTYLITPGGQVLLSGFINPGGELLFTVFVEGSTELAEGFATREASGDALAALEASSIDYYAALRSAYYQNRTALIWRRGPGHGPAARARQVLAALSLGAPGGEVVDLGADGGGERVEAATLEH